MVTYLEEAEVTFCGIIHSDNSKDSPKGTTHLGEHYFKAHMDLDFGCIPRRAERIGIDF